MFAHFNKPHEDALIGAIQGRPPDAEALAEAMRALNNCLADIVGQLRLTSDASARRELRTLYEGLTIAVELMGRPARVE